MKLKTIIHCEKHKKIKTVSKMYLSWENKVEVMRECGDSAALLFEYYVDNAYKDNYAYPDKEIASTLGWPERKVQKLRLDLTKHKYFLKRTFRSGDDTMVHYFIGKTEVLDNG